MACRADAVAPGVLLITETNVPHADNISYFGAPLAGTAATDEAQMVYNFSLAPLTLHALQTGDAGRLSHWAATLKPLRRAPPSSISSPPMMASACCPRAASWATPRCRGWWRAPWLTAAAPRSRPTRTARPACTN
ncbi:hypothetical protein [Candidatus Amarolinea dominans]|uniref:hypothetical protein n=1 Tax=Candidatus Amarolinea dominans TaxID=3140696 RepID=UPI0031CC6E01